MNPTLGCCRHLSRALVSLVALGLGMTGCTSPTSDNVFTVIRPANSSGWSDHDSITFDLLLKGSHAPEHIDLGVRFDNRLESMSSQLEVKVSRGINYSFVDTLEVHFADRPGRRKEQGTTIHEQITEPSRPLTIPATGIYQISVRPLDSIPLRGIIAVGARIRHMAP